MRFVSALLLSTLLLDSTIALGSRGVFSIDDIENAEWTHKNREWASCYQSSRFVANGRR